MILSGAIAAISPTLEEAAQTLRASRARVFRTVTWPLLRPALANAFLLGFVESLADFANPVVLAGNFEVLSTKIFFAIAGAQHDPGRAASLAVVLLIFTLIAFWLQQRWLGRASYVSVGGKGDSGIAGGLARRPALGLHRHGRRLDRLHAGLLRRDRRRRLRQGHRPRRHEPGADPHQRRLRHRLEHRLAAVHRFGLGQLLHHHRSRRGRRAADRRGRPVVGLRDHAPPLRRSCRLRVPDHGQLRGAGHRDRRGLHRGLQRRAARTDRRHGDPGAVLRLPQHARRRARGHRGAGADRQVARRSLVDACAPRPGAR